MLYSEMVIQRGTVTVFIVYYRVSGFLHLMFKSLVSGYREQKDIL